MLPLPLDVPPVCPSYKVGKPLSSFSDLGWHFHDSLNLSWVNFYNPLTNHKPKRLTGCHSGISVDSASSYIPGFSQRTS